MNATRGNRRLVGRAFAGPSPAHAPEFKAAPRVGTTRGFGVEHLEAALSASGRCLVVLDPTGTADDLVRDITEVRMI